jgi:WD40-like Beta Propeller Repeat
VRRASERRLAQLLLALAVWVVARSARAGDPYLEWYTLKTPHFRLHYHGGLEQVAQRTADVAESVYATLTPQLGWRPSEVTELVISDNTDSANGSASALPYNTVRLFATAPDDMSALGDYDDWISELVHHEYTHILHLDNVSGIPALINAVMGKTAVPNQAQPHWILEGLAVVMESQHTSGGRLRSTQFDMYLRADVLEGHLAGLDQISNFPRRWPGGSIWYLYGAKFIEWIVARYGPNTFAAVASDYGATIVPWAINRSIRRVTGKTYEELYAEWYEYLMGKYRAQTERVLRRGLREGRRITERGYSAATPRFMPNCDGSGRERVLYFRDDGNSTAGLYELDLDATSPDADATLIARAGGSHLSFDPECGVVFDSPAPSRRLYILNDLFRQPPGTRSPRGIERNRQRLSIGARARDPDVSPDGRFVSYVTNRAGTSTLRIARVAPDHQLSDERRLVPSALYEQAYTPRFSPDGHKVAYSAWTRGGYRDIRVADVETGSFFEVTHDRALDQQPTWSPDGRTLYFVSDRSGIPNIYAYEFETRTLEQVTNVLTGAYMPDISPDGRRLVYVGYTSIGFDLFTLTLDRAHFLPAEPAPDDRETVVEPGGTRRWLVEPYNPLPTLRPYAYTLSYGPGTFGNTLTVATRGSDAVGLHGFSLQVSVPVSDDGEVQGSASYVYTRLPFAFRASVFQGAALRRDYRYGEQIVPTTEHLTGVTNSVALGIPGDYDGQSVSLSYSVAWSSRSLPTGTLADPYAQVPTQPYRGVLASVGLGYSFSNVESSVYAVSGEKGFSFGVGLDVADPAFGSESTLTAVSGGITAYQLMPWARHHVLALAFSGATATGSYARRGLYSTGGYSDVPLLDAYLSILRDGTPLFNFFRNAVPQSPFVLRGYAPGQFIGEAYNLLNAEYRFPIWYADRGLSTLPAFLRTVSGTVFFDYGGAYDQIDPHHPFLQFHPSTGAELWIETVLGYAVGSNLRLGVARGLDSKAPPTQTYAVLSSAF